MSRYGARACASQFAELRPEAAVDKRAVEPADRFPLDDHSVRQHVIAARKPLLYDLEAEIRQRTRDAIERLPRIDDDSADWRHAALQSVRRCRPLECSETLL
jgi:hypothetical protein